MEPRAVVKRYKREDLDNSGMPRKDSDNNLPVPIDTFTFTGTHWVDAMFEMDMRELEKQDSYQAWLQAVASKGAITPYK